MHDILITLLWLAAAGFGLLTAACIVAIVGLLLDPEGKWF